MPVFVHGGRTSTYLTGLDVDHRGLAVENGRCVLVVAGVLHEDELARREVERESRQRGVVHIVLDPSRDAWVVVEDADVRYARLGAGL